ncbi:MAG TPA: UDP-N-acetylmuramyl peptide synthase [Bifidobacterium sp.]|nr:UDP-N-acetylmuramyl peptide synthase [Bifidobacterium sp.]HAK71487.1 UDP-N-acetylmuramyl peptide synthase [Bifidobacterium sp.]
MSAVSEAMNRRMTLGMLSNRYGCEIEPPSATEVTVTSIADAIDSVRPGALFIPSTDTDAHQIETAQSLGAYAAVVPRAMRGTIRNPQIPLVYADLTEEQLGVLASTMAGSPSDSLAVFAVAGEDDESVEHNVRNLADFLHMLGNPVGVVSASDSQSLERFLNLRYPLSILDVQRTLAVCMEDGAAAVILALDKRTLDEQALQAVNIDVLGCSDTGSDEKRTRDFAARFGCVIGKHTHIARRTSESDLLAAQASSAYDESDAGALSLSIAMVLAAGVRKANIKSALRVSRDMQ